jgi:hypothetical protein
MIPPKLHGVIDYLIVSFLLLSPTLFSMDQRVSLYTYILACFHLLTTLFTNFSGGLLKIIPLYVHGFIELLTGSGAIIMACTILKYNEAGEFFYTGFGIFILAVYMASDYEKPSAR